MKRKLIMILALSAALTMLAACSNANENSQAELDNYLTVAESTSAVTESEEKQETSVSEETYEESTTDTSAESSETTPALSVEYEDIEMPVQNQISDEEINMLLQGRVQINNFLMYDMLQYDMESKTSINGYDYYRVSDEKYDEWNEWTTYVKSIYVDEAAEMIFNDFKIIEINGKTYTNDGCMGKSISDEYTYEIASEANDTVTILLKNTDNFTSETIETEIILAKTSNGWRIKNY